MWVYALVPVEKLLLCIHSVKKWAATNGAPREQCVGTVTCSGVPQCSRDMETCLPLLWCLLLLLSSTRALFMHLCCKDYTSTHLHGVDGSLCGGSSQRSCHEPLVGLHLTRFTGQQLLILVTREHENRTAQQDHTSVTKVSASVSSSQHVTFNVNISCDLYWSL